jgi:chromosome segregation ATPase
MRLSRLSLALLLLLALPGCGYVHFGRLPEAATTVVGDEKLLKENSDLRLEKKMLQQELALTRAQGEALRFAIENRNADGDTSRRLTEKLNETTRELATLRANYAKLQAERAQAPGASPTEIADLKAQLGATEDKLADTLRNYTQLTQEVAGLRTEVEQKRTENAALAEQVKAVTAQNEQAKAALAQLNTDFLAQKDARAKAEQDAATLRTQLTTANEKLSVLAQQRTAAAGDAKALGPAGAAAELSGDALELRAQLETLRKKVWALEAERNQLQQQLAAAEDRIKRPGEAEAKALADALANAKMLRDENENLKGANIELTHAKNDLEAQLAKAQAGGSASVAALRDELAQTQATVNSLNDENARLKARLNAAGLTAPAAGGSSVTATLVTNASGAPRSPGPGAPRYHTVSAGDTLARISILYYGTPARWNDILAANRDVLGEDNNLVIGRQLRIP